MKKTRCPTLPVLVADFLDDLARSNRSVHTVRAYRADLAQLAAFHRGRVAGITAEVLRSFLHTKSHLAPASRARLEASIGCFLRWCYRLEYIESDPMVRLERVRRTPGKPRGLARAHIEKIMAIIPAAQIRDRLLFRLLFETGLRISEALRLRLEELELDPDDEHLVVVGKRQRVRRILLEDPKLLRQLRAYLKATGHRYGLLFRALKNGTGDPLCYQSIQERWSAYCAEAGVPCTLHQLRHSHATELVNSGVSLAAIRKRLGHQNMQTTLLYAELSDAACDAEIRKAGHRRRR